MSSKGAEETKMWTLGKEEELRIEVDADHPATLTVRTHTAARAPAAHPC